MFHKTGMRSGGPVSDASGSPSAEAEMLVKALRNVIIPLVRPADRDGKCDVNDNALGMDGKEFIIALENFMTSFLCSQRGPVGGIEVELEEKKTDKSTTESHEPPEDGAPKENTSHEGLGLMEVPNKESRYMGLVSIRGVINISAEDRFKQRKSRFIKKALIALREHVFNTMPIRLLQFKPDGSKLQITLVERGEIYAHIASHVESINFADVSRKITHYKRSRSLERAEQIVMEYLIREYSRYAILSHTWLRGEFGEITYGDWIRREFDAQKPGYRKLVDFCRTAWKDYGVAFGWMDTICINKESSAELDESIRSMYKWYKGADVCITYLAETVALSAMSKDTWFTRGWTLQELLAPFHIKFYNTNWDKLVKSLNSDKYNSIILKGIEDATTITPTELRSPGVLSLSRKMQMAATRQVTREEDSAYSLMGILNISIATAYGEGVERAFSRLLQEVLNSSELSSGVADMFNWAGPNPSRISHLLPTSLRDYLHRSSSPNTKARPVEPIMLTHLGLRITIVLMPAIPIQNPTDPRSEPFGEYHAIADIAIHPRWLDSLSRYTMVSGCYSVLDARISDSDGCNKQKNLTLGILNVAAAGTEKIIIPKYCLAVALQFDYSSPITVHTEVPITFTLNKGRGSGEGPRRQEDYYVVKRNELEGHGMNLVTVVL